MPLANPEVAIASRFALFADGVLHEQNDARTERAYFQTRVMRLTNPNDELGGMLFLATPQVVSHRIDPWSPAFPPSLRKALAEGSDGTHDGASYHFPGLVFREADREVALADEGSPSLSRRSSAAAAAASEAAAAPRTGDRATLDELMEMKERIRSHFSQSELEVMVLVEATDPHSGNAFQARHSYTARDIIFDKTFVPSMMVADDGSAKLDWDKFHEVLDVPFNSQMIGGSHS